MNYRRKALVEAFDVDLKTIRKWGNALKRGQLDMIEAAFAGHAVRRKLTPEIESYARSRFRELYQDNRYNFSSIIRYEIKEHFGKTLCAETLRPVFKDEKGLMGVPVQPVENDRFRDAICDSVENSSSSDEKTRNQIPSREEDGKAVFLHHAGILLLLQVLKLSITITPFCVNISIFS